MTKIYLPGEGPLAVARTVTLCLLLLLASGLPGCSPPNPGETGVAAPPPKETPAPETTKAPPPADTKPARKLPEDLEQLRKDIQPEKPAEADGKKEPAPPKQPVVLATKPAPPQEAAKTPEPAKAAVPPEGVDEKKLLATLNNSMILLGRAFESGNAEEIGKFMVVDDDLKAILTGGGYNILGVSLESQNLDAIIKTLKATNGKKLEHEFISGKMTYTPNNSIFKKKVPTMSQSKLVFKIDGTPVPFIFYIKQLVWFGGKWKVFNAGI